MTSKWKGISTWISFFRIPKHYWSDGCVLASIINDTAPFRSAVFNVTGTYSCRVDLVSWRSIQLSSKITKFSEMSRTSEVILGTMNKRNFHATRHAISGCFLPGQSGHMLFNACVAIENVRKPSIDKAILTTLRKLCASWDKNYCNAFRSVLDSLFFFFC